MKYIPSFFFKQNENLVAATGNLLKLLNINITSSITRDAILSNPNYPSLLSVSESLKLWGVDSEAYTISTDKLQLLPTPFIAHLRDNSGTFVTVKTVADDTVTYLEDDQAETTISTRDFFNKWTNTVLLTEVEAKHGQDDFEQAHRRELLTAMHFPLFVFILLFSGILQFEQSYRLFAGSFFYLYLGYWFFTIAGTIVSGLLLALDYDNNNSYLKKICSINKKTDCNAVLNSGGSKILGFSWSEIGLFYFFGSFLYLIINPYHVNALYPLTVLNIIALPYIVFSVYYQAFVVKQWCPLCLTIQFILLAEFLTSVLTSQVNNSLLHNWQHVPIVSLIVAYALPFILWVLVKPYILGAAESENTSYNFKRFKNNPEVFNSILLSQPQMKYSTEGLGISLGNPEAKNTLIKVCNPYCGPCAQSFPHLQELLKINPNWKVQIIFGATPDENDLRALPVAHFLASQSLDLEGSKVIDTIAGWYNAKEKDYKNYAIQYPVTVDFELQKPKLAAMHQWFINENIQYTPTYFVNGRVLPDSYSVEDLKNIL